MNTILKIQITIDSEIGFTIQNETKITKMIFPEYNYSFDYSEIIQDLKTALKINKKFKSITIDFLINKRLEKSYRVINYLNELKGCEFSMSVGSYYNFEFIEKKEINKQIKNITEFANEKFSELINTKKILA